MCRFALRTDQTLPGERASVTLFCPGAVETVPILSRTPLAADTVASLQLFVRETRGTGANEVRLRLLLVSLS